MIFKDAQNDNLRQGAHIEEFVRAGVNLIIVSPKEAAPLTRPVQEAYRKGIPVIVARPPRTWATSTPASSAPTTRRSAGRPASGSRRLLGGKGNVVELKGLMTSTPGQDRHSRVSGGHRRVGAEGRLRGGHEVARAERAEGDGIGAGPFPAIDLVYAHNDPGAHGAYLAAKAAGREKKMLFVGIDGLPHEGQMYVRQGILAASFEYPTGGREAIETARRHPEREGGAKGNHRLRRVYLPKANIDKGGEKLSE